MDDAAAARFAPVRGRRVVVYGVRVAGAAAARALLPAAAQVALVDRTETAAIADLVAAGARWLGHPDQLPAGTDLLVVSPGVPPHDLLLRAAEDSGVPVWGEIELAWKLRGTNPAPWLALTGTNGKTTTVRMLEAMLRAHGLRTAAVGNVGVPVVEAVVADAYEVLAVELSSQQLHFAPSVAPAAGALLNLAPDHLDWHGSFAAYQQAKAAIWRGDVAIGNLDDALVADLLRGVRDPVGFTLGEPGVGQLGVVAGGLTSNAFGDDGLTLGEVADVRPAGAHNVANALAAAALARAFGVPAEAISRGLRQFVPDPHRNQQVLVHRGVRWVDDSKATNPHAAAASLAAYPRVVWVAGGQLKGVDVGDLIRGFADRLAAAVLLGQDRNLLAASLARHAPNVPVITIDSTDDGAMTEVVAAAAGLARPGDTVLLAPAGASYDMFANYAARGDAFAAAARALAEGDHE
jgi:UDP-N-acetylmuramoylalanine--D-glutamate ligase